MPEVWPSTLPQAFNEGDYSEGMADNLIRSEMEYGVPKVRRRTTAGIRPISGSMWMNATQLAALETFVNTALIGGSLAFTFPNPRGGTALLVRFAKDGLPSWKPKGFDGNEMAWDVSIKLEVLP